MKESEALASFAEEIGAEAAGFPRGSDGVVMLSGGADSAVLAAVAVRLLGPRAVYAVHLNYGLRPDADEGEEAARALCAQLRIDLHIERPELGEGNLQARAREARYGAAERLRGKLGAEWIATGHTRTDVLETMLYRLAVSPGTRALGGCGRGVDAPSGRCSAAGASRSARLPASPSCPSPTTRPTTRPPSPGTGSAPRSRRCSPRSGLRSSATRPRPTPS